MINDINKQNFIIQDAFLIESNYYILSSLHLYKRNYYYLMLKENLKKLKYTIFQC